jgi:multidrug efflux system membrane fusion protein
MQRFSLVNFLPTSLLGVLLLATAGCQRGAKQVAAPEPPAVPVSHPVEREVTDFYDFTGQTGAFDSVNIIARVTGYLEPPLFEEGSEVKKGDLLFEIDPRPYQFQLDQAVSQVKLNEAQLELAKSTLARYEALDKSTPGAVSKQALDQYRATVVEAKARVDAQQKSLEIYHLNKEFTRVVSPIDGQVSRYYLTRGNLVNQDQTLLTTVVSLDPIYAYFDMDERTLLQIRKAIADGKIIPPADGDVPVLLGLQNEDGFPHKGRVNFVNNQVNPTTGSITMRGLFDNPQLTAPGFTVAAKELATPSSSPGQPKRRRLIPRLMSPGMFVRIRLPIGQPHKALLIRDQAIQSDQGLKFVYVIDKDKKAQQKSVTTGALQEDGLRVVTGEVLPTDLVIVGGVQQVRLHAEVKPEEIPMPTLSGREGKPVGGPVKGGKSKGGPGKQ